jgi:hypothetical protein
LDLLNQRAPSPLGSLLAGDREDRVLEKQRQPFWRLDE